MATGITPVGGFGMPDGAWLRALAAGLNFGSQNSLVATPGGTKAAALQIAAGVPFVKFGTVAATNDSGLLPQAKAGTFIFVQNAGADTLTLYGKGSDTINLSTTATGYDLTTGQCAAFFCAEDGNWGAIKTA